MATGATAERRGDWMQVFTGGRFWPLDPRPDEIHIEDVAHALAQVCRYQGHTSRFYSVAEHSLLMAGAAAERGLGPEQQLQALMHDAAEAYICDVVRPVKLHITGYQDAEARVEEVIRRRFGLLAAGKTPEVDELDRLILFDESTALLRQWAAGGWAYMWAPGLGVDVVGLAPGAAEAAFLETFHRLYQGTP